MNIISLGFVILLVLLSGVVAYGADWLGRKLGKKKLQAKVLWWKLRPRHTAALFTVLGGMFVTLATIAILAASSNQVRVWLLEGSLVQEKLIKKQGELDGVIKQFEGSQQNLNKVRFDLADEKKRLEEEKKKVADATKLAATLEKEAAQLKSEVSQFKGRLEASRKELESLKKQVKKVEEARRGVKANLDTASKLLDDLSKQNVELDMANKRLENEVAAKKIEAANQQERIDQLNIDLDKLQKTTDEQLKKFREQTAEAQNNLAITNSDLEEAQRQVAILARKREDLNSDLTRALFSKLIVPAGDELARVAIRSSLTATEAKNYTLALLTAASERAKALKAVPLQGTTDYALVLALDKQGNLIPQAQALEAYIRAASGSKQDQVLIAKAARNSFDGEPAYLNLQIRPNKLIYRQGQVIAEMHLEGRLEVDAIFKKITDFVRTTLSSKALKDGMIPAYGQESPLGEIPSDKLSELVRQLKEYGKDVRIQFVATVDTRAADQMKMELRPR